MTTITEPTAAEVTAHLGRYTDPGKLLGHLCSHSHDWQHPHAAWDDDLAALTAAHQLAHAQLTAARRNSRSAPSSPSGTSP